MKSHILKWIEEVCITSPTKHCYDCASNDKSSSAQSLSSNIIVNFKEQQRFRSCGTLCVMRSLTKIFVVFIVLSSCSSEELSKRLSVNAKELLKVSDSLEFRSNSNNPTEDIVHVGSRLHRVLLQRNIPIDSIQIEIHNGDLHSYKLANVSHSILYKTNYPDIELLLRMRYDGNRDKFHIVGYTGSLNKPTKNKSIDTSEVLNIINLNEYLIRVNKGNNQTKEELKRLKESINYDSILRNKDIPTFEAD